MNDMIATLLHAVKGDVVPMSRCVHDPALLARSYPMPSRFPFGAPFHLVMESRPRSCDLYDGASMVMKDGSRRTICQLFSDGVLMQPEVHTRQVVASFLGDCRMRRTPCRAVDIGSNNGWVSGMMLQLGVASLTTVEPQADLANAFRETVKLNCWDRSHGHSVRVLSNAITLDDNERGRQINLKCGWRLYHFSKHKVPNCTAAAVPISDVFTDAHYDFVKIDVDGIDGELLRWLRRRLASGALRVDTLLIECSGCEHQTLWSFQHELGYHAFLLDNTDERRYLDARGHDVASGFATIPALDTALEERYAQRFLRHVFYVRPSADRDAWRRINTPRAKPKAFVDRGRNPTAPREYVFTKLQLAEPEMLSLLSDKRVKSERSYSDATRRLCRTPACLGIDPE